MEQIQSDERIETPEEVRAGPFHSGDTTVLAPDEIDASAMGGFSVEHWDYQQPKRGEIRTGTILAITDQEIIVDVGAKRDGIVPLADLQRMEPEELASLAVGDQVPVCVLRPEDQDGNLMVSLHQARQEKDWLLARERFESGEVWEGEIVGYNKGGLVIPLGGIRGFLPASQLAGIRPNMTQDERLGRLEGMVGEKMMVKVIEINRRKRRLILSATMAQRSWRQHQRERLLDELREGEVRQGVVTSLTPFGAFVDLGGADGLVHLSELTWRRVRHPKEVVAVGQRVDVLVLRLDQENNRIALSMRRLEPEPWALVEDNYELGQLVEGVVTNVADFGAFAEIEPGVEGLVHITELSEASVTHPREVVKKGDQLLLRIIRIDTRRKRLGLSLKRVLQSEWAEWMARRPAPPKPAPRPAPAPEPEPIEAEEAVPDAAPPIDTPEPMEAEKAVLDAAPPIDTPENNGGETPADVALDVSAVDG